MGMLAPVFEWFCRAVGRMDSPKASVHSEIQHSLFSRLLALDGKRRKLFAIACLVRVRRLPWRCDEPEDPRASQLQESALAIMWDCVRTNSPSDFGDWQRAANHLYPDPDGCQVCDDRSAPGTIIDTMRLDPFRHTVDFWPEIEADHAISLVDLVWDYIDQVAMNALCDGTFNPPPEVASAIVAGTAWKARSGVDSFPLMRDELAAEEWDLAQLESTSKWDDLVREFASLYLD